MQSETAGDGPRTPPLQPHVASSRPVLIPAFALALTRRGTWAPLLSKVRTDCFVSPTSASSYLPQSQTHPLRALPKVRADRRQFRDDLLAAHRTAVRVGGTAIAIVLGALAAGALAALKAMLGAGLALLRK